MSREHVLVVFRGTKTRQIVEEYVQKTGQHPNEVLVVCRDNDNLAQPGDRTVDEAIARLGEIISADEKCPGQQDRITVICNGGTTAQAIPFLMRLVSPAPDAPWYYGLLEFLEVQPDGVKCLWGRGRHLCADERDITVRRRPMPRHEDYDPDGLGARPHPVHDMPPVLVRQDGTANRYAVPEYHDYWQAVTDVPCPCCKTGTVRWAEAGYVPGYRICDGCGKHFMAEGSARTPTLIELEEE